MLDLYKHYSSQEELSQVVVHDLIERGKECKKLDNNTFLVNNKNYTFSERMYPIRGFIVRQAVLKKIN